MKNIMLINHYNLNNGDKAVLQGTVSILEKHGVENMTVSAYSVEEFKKQKLNSDIKMKVIGWGTKDKNKLQRFYLSRIVARRDINFIKKNIKNIYTKEYIENVNKNDIVLVSGGHHITDIVGDYTFYRLVLDMILPLLLGKDVYLLPQTIGYFKNETDNKVNLVKYILEHAKLIGIRDLNSESFINRYNCTRGIILPDMVYGLDDKVDKGYKKDEKTIGIALYGNYTGDDAKDRLDRYLTELASAINTLCDKGWFINFIPMELKNTLYDDRKLMSFIMSKVKKEHLNKINIEDIDETNIMKTIKAFAMNKVIIAYKTHSVVFSLLQSIPVLGVAYHQKSKDFMEKFDLGEYCIWDEEATAKNIVESIEKIEKNYDFIKNTEEINTKKLSNLLDKVIVKILNSNTINKGDI